MLHFFAQNVVKSEFARRDLGFRLDLEMQPSKINSDKRSAILFGHNFWPEKVARHTIEAIIRGTLCGYSYTLQ